MKKKIIIICGPTGVGKTGFAIESAERFNGEIVGADSMQIYKYMDIGTAKPDENERSLAPHHVIDFLEPDKDFDAGKYIEKADEAINDIYSRSKLPIIAGGTGLYIKALIYGLFRTRDADPLIIDRLEKEKDEKGSPFLHKRLSIVDPESAQRIHPNDSFRIIRALEIIESTGNTISFFQNEHSFSSNRYIPLKIGIYMDREALYQRIEKRVDIMIEQGFAREVENLISMGYDCNLKSMNSIGYRHICDFLKNNVEWDETIRLLKRDTRRYAKRQLTWFRQDKDINWVSLHSIEETSKMISNFIQ